MLHKFAYPAFLVLILSFSSCYSVPEIAGFSADIWNKPISGCDAEKLQQAEILVQEEAKLLSKGEAQIKKLLGAPDEHELYDRNQKFFYYDLNAKDCNPGQRLSIRFDALDRVKEVMIIVR